MADGHLPRRRARTSAPGSRRRGPAVAIALLAAVAALVSGCASMPTSGPVQAGRTDYRPRDNSGVKVYPRHPQPGWSQTQIVAGFLAAMAGQTLDVAREYLTRDAARSWPDGRDPSIVVYTQDEGYNNLQTERDDTVSLDAPRVATITSQGEYRPSARGDHVRVLFRLQRVRGQWRIVSLPGYQLLDTQYVNNRYLPFQLYFLARDASVLVADPIVLRTDERDQWPRQLMERLLAGPPPELGDAVRSAIPEGTELVGNPVRDVRGTLTVGLSGASTRASPAARNEMIAQITATMVAVAYVSRVRIAFGENEVTSPRDQRSIENVQASRLAVRDRGYFVRDGKLVAVEPSSQAVSVLKGPYGTHRRSPSQPAISLDGTRIATVSGRTLSTAPVDTAGEVRGLYRGADLSTPSWDRKGDLWVVDNAKTGPRVLMFRDGRGEPVPVPASGLGRERVSEFRVAWDGVQVAVISPNRTGDEVRVGILDRSGKVPRLTGLYGVAPDLDGASDVWWSDADTLAVVASSQSDDTINVYLVAVDGLSVQPAGPVGATQAAAAFGRPLLAVEPRNRLVAVDRTNFAVTTIGAGATPVYPG